MGLCAVLVFAFDVRVGHVADVIRPAHRVEVLVPADLIFVATSIFVGLSRALPVGAAGCLLTYIPMVIVWADVEVPDTTRKQLRVSTLLLVLATTVSRIAGQARAVHVVRTTAVDV